VKEFSGDAHQGQSAACLLVLLYQKLSAAPEGSEEHNRIKTEIAEVSATLEAQHELLHELAGAHDLERALQMLISNSLFEERFEKQVHQLTEDDLTHTEALRLLRLIEKREQQIRLRQAERAKIREKAPND
jgi:hypothetical protein